MFKRILTITSAAALVFALAVPFDASAATGQAYSGNPVQHLSQSLTLDYGTTVSVKVKGNTVFVSGSVTDLDQYRDVVNRAQELSGNYNVNTGGLVVYSGA